LDLQCAKRSSPAEEPAIKAAATRPVNLIVEWAGGRKTIQLD
jgi:hypothetical protein